VAGGGVTLVRCLGALKDLEVENEDQKLGVAIVRRALEEPLRQIAQNAGQEGSVVIQTVKGKKGDIGFDAQKEEYVDMVKAGIIDPAKVTRSAIQNAASVAGLMLTTAVLITDIEEENPAPAGGGGMGGMGGMPGMM
jgi:chaperonin GroEL